MGLSHLAKNTLKKEFHFVLGVELPKIDELLVQIYILSPENVKK